MANGPRLTAAVCEHAEGVQDTWDAAWADRHISPAEGTTITVLLAEHVAVDADRDEQAAILAVEFRRGIDAPRARRLRAERARRLAATGPPGQGNGPAGEAGPGTTTGAAGPRLRCAGA